MSNVFPSSPTPASRGGTGCLLVAMVGLVISICGMLALVQIIAPFAGARRAGHIAVLVSSVIFGLLFGGALTIARAPRMRAALHAWLLALPLTWVMVPAAMFPSAEAQIAAVARVALIGIYLGALWIMVRWRFPASVPAGWRAIPLAAGTAALLALPWLAWGALGSLLDIVLGLAAAVLFGIAAALLITQVYLRPLPDDPDGPGLLAGSAVTSILLLILGWNVGIAGQSLILMPLLPALGWLAGAIAGIGSGRAPDARACALFVALVIAPPLLFADPDTLHIELLAQGREGIAWALGSVSVSVLLALVAAGVVPTLRRYADRAPRAVGAGALMLWLTGAAVYSSIGQPGFYGDRLFVILKDQADLSSVASIADYQQRRRAVYETLVRHANATQSGLRADLSRLGVWHQPYYLMNALEVEGGVLLRLWLATRPEVDRVVPNPVLRPLPEPLEAQRGSMPPPDETLWNLTMINADRVWQELNVRGDGVVIGLMDSGVQ